MTIGIGFLKNRDSKIRFTLVIFIKIAFLNKSGQALVILKKIPFFQFFLKKKGCQRKSDFDRKSREKDCYMKCGI